VRQRFVPSSTCARYRIVVIAGVETEEQRDLLTLTDITTQAQGFHFSKAVARNARASCCVAAAP